MSKNFLLLSLISFIWLTVIPAEAAMPLANLPTFTGSKSAAVLQFNDISGSWAHKSILRMCAVSLLQGENQTTFAPQKVVTYADAVVSAVRLKGLEADAQAEAEKLSQAAVYSTVTTAEARRIEAYLNIAQKSGILTAAEYDMIATLPAESSAAIIEESSILIDEALSQGAIAAQQVNQARGELISAMRQNRAWNASVSRQLALTWIMRATGLKPIYGAEQQHIYQLQDWPNVNTDQLPLLEAALQAGIISGTSQGHLNPKAAITRGELASILDRAFPFAAAQLNYKIQTGIIEQMEYIYATSAMNSGFNHDVGLRLQNLDGTYVQIYVTAGDYSNLATSGSFPLYQSQSLVSPAVLFEGNEVQYITTANTVVWMECR